MPNTTPLAVELYQRAGDGLVPLLVRATGGDTTDIEALIAAAVKQHNEDPEAHPDIRQAIKEAGGGLVTTPVLTLAQRLPVGFPAKLGMTAVAGLNGAHVAGFSVTVGDAAPVTVEAVDDAAEYTFTPNGNEGDTMSVSVIAMDNFGNKSRVGKVTATLFEKKAFVYASSIRSATARYSTDNGLTWKAAPASAERHYMAIASDGTILAVGYDNSSAGVTVRRSMDNGLTWGNKQLLNGGTQLIQDIVATPGMIAILFNKNNSILRSTDNGLTWGIVHLEEEFNSTTSLVATSDGALLMGGDDVSSHGVITRSTDNGLTWGAVQTLENFSRIAELIVTSDGTVIASGYNPASNIHTIRRSTDNGFTWEPEQKVLRSIGLIYDITAISNGTVIMSAYIATGGTTNINYGKSFMYRSTDNGRTWETEKAMSIKAFSRVISAPDGTLIASGYLGTVDTGVILRSTDNGLTWGAAQTLGIAVPNFLGATPG